MSTLQELLNLGLVDIGSDDSRFEKMQSASSALSAKFKEEPMLLIPATLISLDEGVDEGDATFALVEELVVAEWKTLRNTHVNRPRELLRSIIIDALAAAKGEHEFAGVIWNSAASPLRHRQVHLGKATSVIENLLKGAREVAEREAVVRAELAPTAPKKRSKEKGSPERAPLTTSATIPDIVGYIGEFEEQLTEQFQELEQRQTDISQARESSCMRLDVLWWSDALYSPVLQVGYRELELPVAAVAAAVDLATIVPALAPASVCYVLGEMLIRIAQLRGGRTEKSLQEYLAGVTVSQVDFGDCLPGAPTKKVRLPLIDLVGEASTGSLVSPEDIRERAGIDPSLVLSPAEFAMWVFRGIQANRLVEALR